MSDKKESAAKKTFDKNLIWIGLITVALVIGVLVYEYQKKETVTISLGGKEISATFEE